MVEDENLILEIMTETLQDAGFEVMKAVNGKEALSIIDAHGSRFSALVSDYHMPGGLTGVDVAVAIRRRSPGIPVVLATGRADVLAPTWDATPGFEILRKPYNPSELVQLLSKLAKPGSPGHRAR